MPLNTQAASYDQWDTTNIKRKILIVTVAPNQSDINPAHGISMKFGAYPWKNYKWSPPVAPTTVIEFPTYVYEGA